MPIKQFQIEMILSNIDRHIEENNKGNFFHRQNMKSVINELQLNRKETNTLFRELKSIKNSCAVVNNKAIERERTDKNRLWKYLTGLFLLLLLILLGAENKTTIFTLFGR